MPIIKLDPKTSNQIAAGEVIENPASVVKELVENSLDAGAKRIKVILKKGGTQEITVIDDGVGIKTSEMRLSLERHATSKIKKIDDLEQINSLGFRGEALPSIASVSEMALTSRHESEETGARLTLEGGLEKNFQETGFHRGTKITVGNLFFNTPARRKFLKGVAAETARVSRTLQVMALSQPDVSFSLDREQGPLLKTAGDGNLYNVLFQIYGKDLCRHLVPLHYENEGLFLSGFASRSSFSARSRNYQAYFVNRRYVRSNLFKEALDKSFARVVTSRRYPAAFLFLHLDPSELDVNVHPTKIEVRFRNETRVREFMQQVLEGFFQEQFNLPGWEEKIKETGGGTAENPLPDDDKSYRQQHFQKPPPRVFEKGSLPADTAETAVKREAKGAEEQEVPLPAPEGKEKATPAAGSPTRHEEWASKKLIGQAFETYIILQEGESIYFIDQHAAHERIMWEKFYEQERLDTFRQEILPLSLELPLQVADSIGDRLNELEEAGLEVEQFGNHTFIIRSVPFFMQGNFTAQMFFDLFEQVADQTLEKQEFLRETRLQLICKASIKAGQSLTREEMNRLLDDLEKCHNPHHCPHGRPIKFKMPRVEMEKNFKRQG